MPNLNHKNLPVISFVTQDEFYQWLSQHYTDQTGFWLRYYKKNSGVKTIIHDQAVDVALCWGWIDGLINKYDDTSYLVRFTPRGAKSIWSQVNVAKVERLTNQGLMRPSGLEHVEQAKQDGRWDRAYAPASTMTIPNDFLELIKTNPEAYDKFQTLNKSELYSIGFRLSNAKPQKRLAKIKELIDKLQSINK